MRAVPDLYAEAEVPSIQPVALPLLRAQHGQNRCKTNSE